MIHELEPSGSLDLRIAEGLPDPARWSSPFGLVTLEPSEDRRSCHVTRNAGRFLGIPRFEIHALGADKRPIERFYLRLTREPGEPEEAPDGAPG